MAENDINLNMSPDSFSVDDILAEYKVVQELFEEAEKKSGPEPEPAQTHRIVYDSSEQALGEAQLSSRDAAARGHGYAFEEAPERREEHVSDKPAPEQDAFEEYESGGYDFSVEEAKSLLQDSVIKPEPEPEPEPEPAQWQERHSVDELLTEAEISDSSDEKYAAADDYAGRAQELEGESERRGGEFSQRVLSTVAALMAYSAARREKKRREERGRAKRQREREPELRVDRAAEFYAFQAQSVRMRSILATAVFLPLLYLSLGLPALGPLGESPTIKALVCIILELVIMVIGLDVVSNGLLTLIRGKAGAESIVLVSCALSVLDAAYIAFSGNTAVGLPFCGVSALSLIFALWGNYFSCKGFAISFETAAGTETPTVVLAIAGVDEEGCVLAKSKRPVTGFVRSSEASDIFESAYRLVAPVLLIGCVILSLFCFIASDKCDNYLRTLTASTAACGSLSAVFGFAFPFYMLAKRLAKSGAAIAGYSGAADLGRIRRVLVSDTDIFPLRTLSISDISVSENVRPDMALSYTASMIAAAGMGIAPVFTELLKKNGYSLQRVEEFACHEGGGLVASINGDTVHVGTGGFMQLMGIKLPRESNKTSAVYTAINDSLASIVSVGYKPVASVQHAIVMLLRGRCEPLFAIRDFNVTPMLVKQKFRLPLDSYNFPSFAERYKISSRQTEEGGTVAGMFVRGGLNSVAGLSKRGKGLYNRLRICLALSILGAVLGVLLMLMFCWSGSFSSASSGNLIAFMLLWLVPTLVTTVGLNN